MVIMNNRKLIFRRSYLLDVFLVFLILLLLGRLFNFPVSLSIVSGNSMLPVLRPGDLVLGVSTNFAGFKQGDIVIWYATIMHGTVHRVVNVTGTTVITKGDNNPLPDPPIPMSFVRYKAVFIIPREVWLLLVVFTIMVYAYYRRESIVRSLKVTTPSELSLVYIVFTIFMLIDLIALFLVSIPYYSSLSTFVKPSLELRGVTLSNDGRTVLVDYYQASVFARNVTSCEIIVFNTTLNTVCFLRGSIVSVTIPQKVYSLAYKLANATVTSISVRLNVTLDKGWVYGTYAYVINWRPLDVTVNSSNVIVKNPNYIPINLTRVKITYIALSSFNTPIVVKVEELGNMTVNPRDAVAIHVKNIGKYAYVEFTYDYKFASGGVVFERKYVEF